MRSVLPLEVTAPTCVVDKRPFAELLSCVKRRRAGMTLASLSERAIELAVLASLVAVSFHHSFATSCVVNNGLNQFNRINGGYHFTTNIKYMTKR